MGPGWPFFCARTERGQRVTHALEQQLEPVLQDLGYGLVRLQVSGSKRPVLQVMLERQDGAPITVDDCAAASRALSPVLDVIDPMAGAFRLEVSSPGIDRPLIKPQDFTRFTGREITLETRLPVDNRRRFRGTLTDYRDENVWIHVDDHDISIPYANIMKAKLVMTEDLIAPASLKHLNEQHLNEQEEA